MNKKEMPRKLKARREVTPTKKKNKLHILYAVLAALVVLVIAVGIWILTSSPTIDSANNPFNVAIMSAFGRPEAYNFTNADKMNEATHLGRIFTLSDFFGKGSLFESAKEPLVRDKDSYNVMVVGKDRVGSNTDVIMVLNFNTKTQKINVLQIPRDTYVIDPINDKSNKRINAVYAFSYMKYKNQYSKTEASHEALKYLEKTIEDTFGITIDNYFMIDLNGFVKIIDSIGGVEVNVPFDMHYNDPDQNLYIDLKKGTQLLDGNKSEQFVRFRNTYVLGDLGRVSAQKIFLSALIKKLLSPEWYSLDSFTSVATNLMKYTTSGMTLTDVVGYLKKIDFGSFSADSITFYTAQGESFNAASGASYYSLYLEENLEIINKAFNLYNKEVTADHVTLSEQFRSPYNPIDTDGKTATEIDNKPPSIIVARPSSPTTEDEPMGDEPVEDEPVEDEPVEDEPVEDEPVEDEPVEDEPVEDEPVEDEPVEDEPVEDEPVEDEPVEDETDNEQSEDTYLQQEEEIDG